MKKTLRILAVAIFGLILFQHCQKSDFLVVTGVVRDSLTNQPIEGVYIFTENGSARTGADGTFSLEGIRAGKQNINAFSFTKYNYKSRNVIISEGQVNKIDFQLSPIPEPEIQTGSVFDITLNSAKVTGSINIKSGDPIQQYGHCWSRTSLEPTIYDAEDYTSLGSGSGNLNFTSNMNNLQTEKVYYVRAYASTSNGITYGNVVVFAPTGNSIIYGLLSYYSFNTFYNGGNWGYFSDESGNGSNLYSYNWPSQPLTADRFGSPSKALKTNSPTYTYTTSSNFAEFNDFSISFWYKKDSWAGTQKPILNFGYPIYNNYITVNETGNPSKLKFEIKTSSGSTYSISPNSAPSLNNWHHVVFLRNSTSLKLYIDGAIQKSMTCDNSLINTRYFTENWGFFFLGFDLFFTNPGNWDYFNGSLDEVRIYNRALKDSEISTLYKNL